MCGTRWIITYLNHMIRFFHRSIRKAKAVEYLQTPNLQAIRLARIDLGAPLVYYASVDTASCHPSGHHHASRASTDDETIVKSAIEHNVPQID